MTLEFLVTSFIVVAAPGTGVLVVLAAGLSRGVRDAVLAAVGCTLGIVPHMLLAVSGLAAVLQTHALAFGILKFAGVAYLLWMAWSMFASGGALQPVATASDPGAARTVVRAALVNLLNPKLSVFFFAFLPQFIAADAARPLVLMLQLSAVFMAMTLVVFVLYALLAAALRRRLAVQPRVLRGVRWGFAAAFLGLGLRLAWVQRG